MQSGEIEYNKVFLAVNMIHEFSTQVSVLSACTPLHLSGEALLGLTQHFSPALQGFDSNQQWFLLKTELFKHKYA